MTPDSPALPPEAAPPELAAPAASSTPDVSAARAPFAHLRFWLMAVGGLALDLWSKDWAFQTLRQGGRRELVPYLLEYQTMFNSGALFGIGEGQTPLFLLASVLALVLVLWIFWQSSARRRVLHVALGAILAGALGNMYDRAFVKLVREPEQRERPGRYYEVEQQGEVRVFYEYPRRPDERARRFPHNESKPVGHVRDFLKIPTTVGGRELWPWVFNVADALLVCGVAVLAIHLWRDRKRTPKDAAEETVAHV